MEKLVERIAVFILIVGALGLASICGYIENHYTRQGEVVEVYEDNNSTVAVIEDSIGHLWEYETEDLTIGNKVKMVMFTNFTDEDITDDEIIKIKVK